MNQLKMFACCERPPERLEAFGASALSDTELLAILLRSGTQGYDVLTLASRLIAEAGSLAKLAYWNKADFRRLKGIGRVKGGQLVAMMEIARRVIGKPSDEGPLLTRADLVAEYLRPYTIGLDVEKFWVLCLNRKNRLIKRVEVTSGTATAALAHPREVFRAAIRESALRGISCQYGCSSIWRPGQFLGGCGSYARLLREAAKTVEITLRRSRNSRPRRSRSRSAKDNFPSGKPVFFGARKYANFHLGLPVTSPLARIGGSRELGVNPPLGINSRPGRSRSFG